MTVTANAFFAAVSGMIRVGHAIRDAYDEEIREIKLDVFCPIVADLDAAGAEALAIEEVYYKQKDLWSPPGAPLYGLFPPKPESPRLAPNVSPIKVQKAVEWVTVNVWRVQPLQIKGAYVWVSPSVVLSHKTWMNPNAPSRWGHLGLALVEATAGIAAAQPSLFGLKDRASAIVGGIATHLQAILLEEQVAGKDNKDPIGERLCKVFFTSTLETLATNPTVLVRDEHWAPIVGAFLTPLSEEVKNNPSQGLVAEDRLAQLLRGPMALGALQALNTNADKFLNGRYGGDTAIGAVARAVLGEVATTKQTDFDLRRVFSDDGAAFVFRAALEVADKRPELFIKGSADEAVAARGLLRQIASALNGAPEPFTLNGGLAPQLTSLALESAATYLSARLAKATEKSEGWDKVGADAASSILATLMQGFAAGVASSKAPNPFTTLFDRSQAIAIAQIVARHVAATPGLVVGAKASEEVRNIAAGVATILASDQNALLSPTLWNEIVAKVLTIAAKNPGALFHIGPSDAPAKQLGVRLLGEVLAAAGEAMAGPRKPGQLLFGETLKETIFALLEAAASNTLVLLKDAQVEERLNALRAFIKKLEKAATSDVRDLRMGAGEWNYVFRYFVAHILDKGEAAKITDDQIADLLRGVEPFLPSRGAAG